MKRIIDYYLGTWKNDKDRLPLLLRGARQVGKTHAARTLGSTFSDFVEVNLELMIELHATFKKDLQPERILREISVFTGKSITPGKTLLFLDEIQVVPEALLALRYFYEMIPELHVIAAGSLLDFAIEKVGIPVGRVQSLYMYPLSFIEFLAALDENLLIEEILAHELNEEMSELIHKKALTLIGEYLALGGMPQVVKCWKETKDILRCSRIHNRLLDAYRQDFGKYARRLQIKYVEMLFEHMPLQLGKKFKYSLIEGDYRKRELAPALDLLVTAGVSTKIFYSSAQGVPLGAQIDPQDYKVMFLDVGLSQAVLGLDLAGWFLHPITEFVNKGSLVEAFVGQELLAYSDPMRKKHLYYWHRKERASQAEVDYLIQERELVVPIEVKSGSGKTLRSIHLFLETHPNSYYGIRFSTHNYSSFEKIDSYPLYAVAKIASLQQQDIRQALEMLAERKVR